MSLLRKPAIVHLAALIVQRLCRWDRQWRSPTPPPTTQACLMFSISLGRPRGADKVLNEVAFLQLAQSNGGQADLLKMMVTVPFSRS